MATNDRFGGIILEKYYKPSIVASSAVLNENGIIPFAAAVAGMSIAQLATAAASAGLAAGAATKVMKANPVQATKSLQKR